MTMKLIRVVLTVTACVEILAATSTTNEQEHGVKDLMTSSGYMVAVG